MTEIIPAIMPYDYDDLLEKVTQVADVVDTIQIDIMDGQFVPGKTWPYNMKDEPNFLSILREEDGLPCWDRVDFELDLMVESPDEALEQWMALGPKRVVFHVESLKDPQVALEAVQKYREHIEISSMRRSSRP
jgi:pentose-5-phosphate-3-epimerase